MKNFFIALSILIALGVGFYFGSNKVKVKPIINTVTIVDTLVKVDTLILTINKPILSTIVRYDTIYLNKSPETAELSPYLNSNDSTYINIPIEEKHYKEDGFTAIIEGYKPELKYIEIYPVTKFITKTETVYKQSKFGYGPSVGFGYGIFNNKPDLFLGFSVNYNF